jgi:opacity protein-like surface antigen
MLAVAVMLFAVLVVGSSQPAAAQEAGERVFEVYGAVYVPGISDLDTEISPGVRFGGRPSQNWGWSFEAGLLDLNQKDDQPLDDRLGSAKGFIFDGDVIWYIAGSDFGLFGGVGWATVDVDIAGTTTDVSDDAFTINYGLHYAWNFGDNFLLKPEIRWRQFQGDTYEKTDEEYSLSFGWRF